MSDLGSRASPAAEASGLASAREFLRSRQARFAPDPTSAGEGVLKAALEVTSEREKRLIEDGEYLREGELKYPVQSERARWKHIREMLKRIDPGPHEDPNYLVLLCRQAASIEMSLTTIDGLTSGQVPQEILSRILIGTTAEPRSRGSCNKFGEFAVIRVSAGLVDLLYQTAKAVSLAWKPIPPAPGTSVGFARSEKAVDEVLDADPTPVGLLADTLSAWLYEGRHRPSYSWPPPDNYHVPLTILTNGAERFVLAHEYAHALADYIGDLRRADESARILEKEEQTKWQKELAADAFAAAVVTVSSATLDKLPMNLGLEGAVLSMKAHEILNEALAIGLTGEIPKAPAVSETHPPFDARIASLEAIFMSRHEDKVVAADALRGMMTASRTASQIWARAAPRLSGEFRAGRRLHPIWSSA
jgi:hypothetical protein